MNGRGIRMLTVIGVGVLLFAGLWGLQAQREQAVRGNGDQTDIVNETISTANATGEVITLNESNRDAVVYDGIESIDLYQNSTNLDPSGNWDWIAENGSVQITDPTGLNTSTNATANVSYGYNEPSGRQDWATSISLLPAQIGEAWLVALMAGVLMTALAALRRVA